MATLTLSGCLKRSILKNIEKFNFLLIRQPHPLHTFYFLESYSIQPMDNFSINIFK